MPAFRRRVSESQNYRCLRSHLPSLFTDSPGHVTASPSLPCSLLSHVTSVWPMSPTRKRREVASGRPPPRRVGAHTLPLLPPFLRSLAASNEGRRWRERATPHAGQAALEGAGPNAFVGPPAQPWTGRAWLHLHERKLTIRVSLTPLWLQQRSGGQALSLLANSDSLKAGEGLPGCLGGTKERGSERGQ